MTYKEKLIELHNITLAKIKEFAASEATLNDDESICEDVCHPDRYKERAEKYHAVQDAIRERDNLAKKINEEKIDINLEYNSQTADL